MSLFCSQTDPYYTKSASQHKDSHHHSLPDLLDTIPISEKAMALTTLHFNFPVRLLSIKNISECILAFNQSPGIYWASL